MGLDMYAYLVRKATEEEKNKFIKNPTEENTDITVFYENFDSPELKDILPYTEKINVPVQVLDLETIKKENNIPEDSYVCGIAIEKDGTTYTFAYGDNETKSVAIDEDKHIMTTNQDVLIVWLEEIGYWRKQYTLQDQLHDAYEGTIYNCGFHKANDEMIELMMEDLDKSNSPCYRFRPKEGYAVFYHEWY